MSPEERVLIEAVKTLTELAEGKEIAAECEGMIVAGLAAADARYDAGERSARLTRLVRFRLEAQSNQRSFAKDAATLRVVLDALHAASNGRWMPEGEK